MNTLGNPYKDCNPPVITRKVVADVGEEDWDHFHRALPFRGNQDQVISHLFYRFMQLLKEENIPSHYEPDNHSRIESILGRITLLPASRCGHHDLDGRGETRASQDSDGAQGLAAEATLGLD